MPQTIGVCGLGFTGSTAVTDLLREYNENFVPIGDIEFLIPYYPGGLLDLQRSILDPIRFFSYDAAEKRFRDYIYRISKIRMIDRAFNGGLIKETDRYLERLNTFSWNGFWFNDAIYAGKKLNRYLKYGRRINSGLQKLGIGYRIKCPTTIYGSPDYDSFINETKVYIRNLLSLLGAAHDKNIVLDQPFPGNDPEKCFVFFENPKAIIVVRDPRDLYITGKLYPDGDEWIPTDSVKTFIKYYKNYVDISCNTEDVITIRFEDLVYNVESTINRIESFLNLKSDRNENTSFKPDVSRNNTQIFKAHPEFAKDIKLIENELSSCLYPFPYDIKHDLKSIF